MTADRERIEGLADCLVHVADTMMASLFGRYFARYVERVREAAAELRRLSAAEATDFAERHATAEHIANSVYLYLIANPVPCPCGNGRIPTGAYRVACDACAKAFAAWLPLPEAPALPEATAHDALQRENDILRAMIAKGPMDCIYCGLPAADTSKCASGFPGCDRADDVITDPRPDMPPAPAEVAAVELDPFAPLGALHASAPSGYKCADCTMDEEPCPTCYAAWWQKRHPNTHQIGGFPEATASGQGGGATAAASRPSLDAQAGAVERAQQTAYWHGADATTLAAAAATLKALPGVVEAVKSLADSATAAILVLLGAHYNGTAGALDRQTTAVHAALRRLGGEDRG